MVVITGILYGAAAVRCGHGLWRVHMDNLDSEGLKIATTVCLRHLRSGGVCSLNSRLIRLYWTGPHIRDLVDAGTFVTSVSRHSTLSRTILTFHIL